MLLVRLSATVILDAVTLTHLEMKEGKNKKCFQPLDNDDKYSYFNETNQACKIHSDWKKSLNIYHSKTACTPESICVFTLFTLGPNVTAVKLMGNHCARISSCMSNLPSIRSNPFSASWAALVCASMVKLQAQLIQWSDAHSTRSRRPRRDTH